MDFLNHREGVMVFYQVFHLSPSQCEFAWVWRNGNLKAKLWRWLWIAREKLSVWISPKNSASGLLTRAHAQYTKCLEISHLCTLLARRSNCGLWFSFVPVGLVGRLGGCGIACECSVATECEYLVCSLPTARNVPPVRFPAGKWAFSEDFSLS
jgi:hypothetical protein